MVNFKFRSKAVTITQFLQVLQVWLRFSKVKAHQGLKKNIAAKLLNSH